MMRVNSRFILILLVFLAAIIFVPDLTAQYSANFKDAPIIKKTDYCEVRRITLNGTVIDMTIINGPPTPPPGFERQTAQHPEPRSEAGLNILSNVPAFNWSFGCSTTSAAMIAGYYDRTGYSNMYAGPTDGGVMPLNNSSWPDWYDGYTTRHQCPLSATHNGLDGRVTNGHVDDYWIQYGATGPDPWVGNWAEHTHGDCTGDYMNTNQWYSSYSLNTDGETTFYYATDGSPTPPADLIASGPPYSLDGGVGLQAFFVSRGYSVTSMYNQYIDALGYTYGFTYAQYCAEIDAGRPVIVHLDGHTIVGLGYDDTSSDLMYVHDTWDYNTYTMTWGGSYSGMAHLAVTRIQLSAPTITFINGANLALDYLQIPPSPPQDNWPFGEFSLNGTAAGATLDEVTVALSGTYSGLSGSDPFRLYASNTDNYSTALPIGTDAAESGGSVTFSSLGDAIPSGDRFYWVTADLGSGATGTINGTVGSLANVTIWAGNPNGSSSYGQLNADADVSLPVVLKSMMASESQDGVKLEWETSSEVNSNGFILEKRESSQTVWNPVASHTTQSALRSRGNQSAGSKYIWNDLYVESGVTYEYRLLEENLQGSVTLLYTLRYKVVGLNDIVTRLEQAYPNPFNPSTQFTYTLAETLPVRLVVVDLLGRTVRTFVQDIQEAGSYVQFWHGANDEGNRIAGGIYFIIMDAGTERQIQKVVFLQ